MDITKSLNINTSANHPIFDPTYINLEYLFNRIFKFFHDSFGGIFSDNFIVFLKILAGLFAIYFIIVIAYSLSRIMEIQKEEEDHIEHEIAEYAHHHSKDGKIVGGVYEKPVNQRWVNVLKYLSSMNSSDWKLAVMEADSMLESLTDQLDLEGDNLGERLKSADRQKFRSLDDAWQAHIVRNRIAHEGSSFELSQHEANRVVVLYENVFREFGLI